MEGKNWLKLGSDPLFLLRRRLLILAFSIRMFFIGVEYSVILPSCLLYMKTFEVNNIFMGLVVAAYPFAGMISLPIIGRIYDKTKRTRELILVLNFLQIVGNIIYAIPFSKWLPLSGRFLAGLGDGFMACALGEITHIYPKSYRTGILSIMELGRVLGLIVGPAITFFIGKGTYYLWTWRLDYATLPGVIMACCWIVYEMLSVCFIYNISKDLTENGLPNEKDELVKNIDDFKALENISPDYYGDSSLESDELVNKSTEQLTEKNSENEQDKTSICAALKEIASVSILMIFYVDVVLWLIQTEFEILLPFVTEFDYHWTPKWTGCTYMIGGVELIVIFLLLYVIGSKCKVRDIYFLIFSSFLTMGSSALLIYEGVPTDINKRVLIFAGIRFSGIHKYPV